MGTVSGTVFGFGDAQKAGMGWMDGVRAFVSTPPLTYTPGRPRALAQLAGGQRGRARSDPAGTEAPGQVARHQLGPGWVLPAAGAT